MRLASLRGGGPDGTLVVVAPDGRCTPASGVATVQGALDAWVEAEPRLRLAADALSDGNGATIDAAPRDFLAPLPRAYHWCEGSTYLVHMERIRKARGSELPADYREAPVVYVAASDAFLAPTDDFELGDEAWGLDAELTVAVITGAVPRGVPATEAASFVRLVVLAHDFTLHGLLPRESATGLGLYQAKPTRAFAPYAVTPDDLGAAWLDGLLHATARIWVNDELLGELRTDRDCGFHFGELIAYAARTRALSPGTIIGSGTVSNRDPAAGFGCLSDKRAVERLAGGEPTTPLLRFGDTVRSRIVDDSGVSLFGEVRQRVVPAGCASPRSATRPR